MGESRVAAQFGIGQAVTRFEDPRLLRGQGRFINDVNLPGQAHAVVLRSPHAHAKIRSIDTEAARRAPGVLAVWTGADYARDGLGMPKAMLPRKRPDGSPLFAPQRPALVVDRVRYVGDPVALIVAESVAAAKDAAELVEVDYAPLPAVTSTAAAGEPGSPPVWDECPDNISHVLQAGDRAAAEAAFARAAHVVRRRYVITRVFAHYMEPRGALGVYDPGEDRLTLHADVQYPHRVRNMLAEHVFKLPEGKVRVIAGDVGGAFAKGMELALKIADFAGFSGRREASLKGGKRRGLGFANAIERAAAPGLEFAEIRFDPSGTAMLLMGTKAQGQGHETTFKPILHERLGLDPAQVQFIDGDTDRVAFGD